MIFSKWPRPSRLPWLLLISALVIAADRFTKNWVVKHVPFGGAIPIYDHILRITHWTNEGAAFSMFADSGSPHTVRLGLIAFTLVAALAVLVGMIRLGNRITLTTVALALIFGRAGQCARPHHLRVGRRFHRGAHRPLPLAGLQCGGLCNRGGRMPAVSGFAPTP